MGDWLHVKTESYSVAAVSMATFVQMKSST